LQAPHKQFFDITFASPVALRRYRKPPASEMDKPDPKLDRLPPEVTETTFHLPESLLVGT
jgi:hypothetical protein